MAEAAKLNSVAKVEKIPISLQLGDTLIDGAVVRPLMFQTFVGFITEAQAMKEPSLFDARVRRVRMAKQVQYYINGSVMPVTMADVLRLSIPDMHKILARLDQDEGASGQIIRDGNGIDQAITYELGTPIPVSGGKEPIRELEFLAKTYGDVEDVIAADTPMHQTAKLIEKVAKPLGTTLMALPSWAINLITIADGITLSRDVLPRFLASPGE